VSLLLLLVPAFCAALLDLTVSPAIHVFGAHPSVCVAVLAAWAVLRRREEAMLLVPAMGLLLGLLGNEPLGASILGLAPVVLLASMRNPEARDGRFAATLGVAAFGAMAYVLVLAVTVSIQGKVAPAPLSVLWQTAATAALTAAVLPLVYLPLARVAWQPHLHGDFRRY
jgi:rod shape-determining protein MreD